MQNPILQDVLALLQQHPAGLSEHAIHRELAAHPAFTGLGEGGSLALFRKHFLVMNALFQLQQRLWDESRTLVSISPLHIQLQVDSGDAESSELSGFDTRPDYYLDWNNYRHTRESDVDSLIDSFWTRYYRQENRLDAMKTLGLEADAGRDAVERRYRQLVAVHHPDKGGDEATFVAIRGAYEQLR